MKQIFSILNILFLIHIHLSAQVLDYAYLLCDYQAQSINDTLNPAKISMEHMRLDIGKNVSRYYSYDYFKYDSLMKIDRLAGLSSAEIAAKNREKEYGRRGSTIQIVKNNPKNILDVYGDIGATFLYNYQESPLPPLKWTLTADTLTILTYQCQKATCRFRGRDYEAWFAPEIPASDGPWKFSGLPGLILKVSDTRGHYKFECIGIAQLKTPKPIEVQKKQNKPFNKISRQEVMKTEKRFAQDPMAFLVNQSSIRFSDAAGNSITSSQRHFPYNPIELE